MKTLYLALIIGTLIIGIATAITFADKDSMLSYFSSYKLSRESNITAAVKSIKYLSNKVCRIDYVTEKISCEINIEIDLNGKKIPLIIPLKEGTSKLDDENTIRNYVNDYAKENLPIEDLSYVERTLTGGSIPTK